MGRSALSLGRDLENTMAALTLTLRDSGHNSASWSFAGGSTGADTIANSELIAGLPAGSRILALLSPSYATQAALDQAVAEAGVIQSANGGSLFRLVTAGPGVPTATITTAGATGACRIALSYSASK